MRGYCNNIKKHMDGSYLIDSPPLCCSSRAYVPSSLTCFETSRALMSFMNREWWQFAHFLTCPGSTSLLRKKIGMGIKWAKYHRTGIALKIWKTGLFSAAELPVAQKYWKNVILVWLGHCISGEGKPRIWRKWSTPFNTQPDGREQSFSYMLEVREVESSRKITMDLVHVCKGSK